MAISDYTPDLIQRFFSKIAIPDNINDCWLWTASRCNGRYGQFGFRGRMQGAHRVMWTIFYGSIPDKMCVCHACDNLICVNPLHLFLGSHLENMADMRAKGRSATGERSGVRKFPNHYPKGEQVNSAILNPDSVRLIRYRYQVERVSMAQLALDFKVRPKTISKVVNRVTWKHIT